LVIHETNPFPSMLGRLCNHPCETDCKRGWVQGPENAVSIKSLKRFATDYAWARRVKIDWQRAPENGRRVAIVGSGPAGMTAAQDLRLMGYQVDLYEREGKLGGLLSASIPHFRFDLDQLNWEIQMIVDMGVNVFLNKNVGKDPKLEQLLNDYEAVYLSVGMMTGRILPVPGSDLPEVISAMEFIRVDETKLEFDPESGKLLINTVQKLPGTEHVIPCRYAIFASGQIMDFAQDQGVPLTPRKLMEADTGGHTKLAKLFAGGDCVQ